MTKQHIREVKSRIIKEVRELMPPRPLTPGECYALAEQQAELLLRSRGIRHPHVDLQWMFDLREIEIIGRPRHKMEKLAGATAFRHNKHFIVINESDVYTRRRFTLAHEFKHVIDYTARATIYRGLGFGDKDRQEQQVEGVCNHFAACLLIPAAMLKRAWLNGVRDLTALAGLFMVSEEAMYRRLKYLGYVSEERDRPFRAYFRREPVLLTA